MNDWGFTGLILDYGVIIFFSFGAMILFLYFWWNNRLDFDESPKYVMLEEEPYDEY